MKVKINDFCSPYIIGETAYNHEGDVNYLYRMIDEISELGLDSVKFHLLLNVENYLQAKHPLVSELKKWMFDEKQWDTIFEYSVNKNLEIIALCDDVESLKYININNKPVFAVEIHATGLNDLFLLREASKFKGTVILGVGGSTIDEVSYAIDFLKNNDQNNIVLMYGFQNYPTDYKDINLSKMLKLKHLFDLPVGYADHTAFNDPNNEVISIMAASMGFNILEKHYTSDEGEKRIDHHAAVGKEKMLKIKQLMNTALMVYGNNSLRMSSSELEYGNTGPMKKAIVARHDIKKGEKLTFDNLCFKRTMEESTIKQDRFLQLIGLESTINIFKDEIIDFSKVKYEFKKTDSGSFTHT